MIFLNLVLSLYYKFKSHINKVARYVNKFSCKLCNLYHFKTVHKMFKTVNASNTLIVWAYLLQKLLWDGCREISAEVSCYEFIANAETKLAEFQEYFLYKLSCKIWKNISLGPLEVLITVNKSSLQQEWVYFIQNLLMVSSSRLMRIRDCIHNTSFSLYLKYKPIKLECFITPH